MSLAPDLQRLTAVILILSAILLAPGCGGDKYHSAQNQESPAASISGRVVKGVISNGLVKVYPVIGGHMGSSPLVEGATDSNGTYSLQLPQHYLGQVVVQITAQDSASTPSLLTCDVPEGCGKYESYPSAGPVDQDRVAPWGEINYGDKIALDPNDGFELLAVSDSLRAGATTVVDVTALSHLTAKWLLSSDVSDEALVQARNQMADLFNLPANYYKLPPIDLTSSSERKGADATQIQVALISASLLSIASNSPGLSTDPKSAAAGVLEQASTVSSGVTTLLNQLADSYVSLGGQLIGRNASSQNPTPSLLDITNAAFAMAQKISADNTIPPSVVSNFSTIQEKLAQLPVGTATQANAGSVEPAETSQQFFADKVWPLLNQDCTVCHSAGNVASSSALIFEPNQTAAVNFDITKSYILLKTAANDQRGATLFPAKPVGQFGHVGGQIYSSGSSSEAVLVSFVDRILNPGAYPSTTGGSSGNGNSGVNTGGSNGNGNSGGVSSTGGPTGSGNSGGTGGTNANGGVDPAVAAAQTAALQAAFNSTIAPFLESKHCALCHSVLVPNLVLKTGSSAAARNANFLAVRTYIEQASDLFKYGFHDKPSRNGIRHDGGKYFENGDATSVAFKTFIDQVIAARPAGYGMPVGADALEMEFLTSISPVMEKEECSFCHKGSGLGFGGLQPFTTLAAREINYAVVRSFIESSPSKYLFHDKPAERGTLHVGGRSFHNGDATSVAFKTFIDHVIAAKNNASGDPAPTTGATPLETKFLTSVSPILQEKSCIGCHKVGTNYGFVLTATDYSANFSSVRNFIENSPKKYLFHDKPSETGVRHVGGKFFSAGDATSIAFKSFIDDVMASKGATN